MTLKQLEAFYWAASSASFLIAAERLHLSQSSLSKRIRELEQQFGRTLFDRSGHKAVLTDAGRTLMPLARKILESADALRSSMADEAGLKGHCRFGLGEHSALTWLPDFVAEARRLYPALTLDPSVDIGARLEEQVDHGLLDFAIVASPATRPSIVAQALADVRFEWAAAPSLAGDLRDPASLFAAGAALITMPAGAGANRIVDQWLAASGAEAARRLTCNSMAAIAGLVVAGAGISLFPQSWLGHMDRSGQLIRLRGRPEPVPLRYFLHWRRDDSRPSIRTLRDLVQARADFARPLSFLQPPLAPPAPDDRKAEK